MAHYEPMALLIIVLGIVLVLITIFMIRTSIRCVPAVCGVAQASVNLMEWWSGLRSGRAVLCALAWVWVS